MHQFGREGGKMELDLSTWPVLVIRVRGSAFADEDMLALIEVYGREVRSRPGTFATVQDLRMTSGITAKQRALLSESMTKNAELNARCAGHAMVISSPVMRGMMTAILWLKKPSYRVEVFADLDSAMAWARGVAAAA